MYEEHAAIEDTIVFPAWKKTMNAKQLDEIGDRFEDIEHKAFGKDGFDDAVDQIEGGSDRHASRRAAAPTEPNLMPHATAPNSW